MVNTSDGLSWNVDTPVGASPRKDGAAEILGLRKGMELRYEKEHVLLAAVGSGPDLATGGGEHKKGSAMAYFEDGAPSLTRPDGATTLTSADSGRLAVDTTGSTYVMKVYDHDDTAFHNVSGTSKIVGSFTAAALESGIQTATVGFVADLFILHIHGWTTQIALAAEDPATISLYTTASQISLTVAISSTDVTVLKNSGITVTGTVYWMALKF